MSIQWNTVTWYSKIIAIILFVATFFLGFWLGTMKVEKVFVEVPHVVNSNGDGRRESILGKEHLSQAIATSSTPNIPSTFCGNDIEKFDSGFSTSTMGEVKYYGTYLFGADPRTFLPLPRGYAKDAKHVWFCSTDIDCSILQNADQATFCYGQHYYAKDSKSVWNQGIKLEGARPSEIVCVGMGCIYVKDDTHVWWYEKLVKDADPKTFEYVNEALDIAKDRQHVYGSGSIIKGVDASLCVPEHVSMCTGSSQ
jgi:hypothetical protein